MKHISFAVLFILIFTCELRSKDFNKPVKIISVSDYNILDEWKYPGFYSAYSAIDNNADTCFAQSIADYKADYFGISFNFDNNIYIDEIRIANGVAKNEALFKENNRLRDIEISLCKVKDVKPKFSCENEVVALKDTKEIQSIKLKKDYFVNAISISHPHGKRIKDCIYKGTKYTDVGITEIELYYKGRKVNILDVDQSKKTYIDNIQHRLENIFSNKIYDIREGRGEMNCYKNGDINSKIDVYGDTPEERNHIQSIPKGYPTRWRVEHAKLFVNIKNTWYLCKYEFRDDKNITLYLPIPGKNTYDSSPFYMDYKSDIK